MTSSISHFRFFELPQDIVVEVGQHLNSDTILSLRSASRRSKQLADFILTQLWSNLMNNAPKGIIDVSKEGKRIVEKNPSASFLSLFRKLAGKFIQNGATTSGKLPITSFQIKDLQKQAQAVEDKDLRETWQVIRKKNTALPQLQTAKQIRDWFAIPSNVDFLSGITQLALSNLNLEVFPPEIAQFRHLQILSLDGNWLKVLPDAIGDLTELKDLSLGYNRLESLSDAIGALIKLQILNLTKNKLKVLPSTIETLIGLQTLRLSENQLEILPDAIVVLTGLKDLSLKYNQLESLPDAIGALTKLEILDLSCNKLKILTGAIGALTELQELNLSFNQLKILPNEMGALIRLNELKVSVNKLETLFDGIGTLIGLQTLRLDDNQLETLPGAIGSLTMLQVLNLNDNPLIFISDEVLSSNCPAIKNNQVILNFKRELEYLSKSPLAKLYQAIIQKKSADEIQAMFLMLSTDNQNLIFEMVCVCSESPKTGDQQWAEHCICDDLSVFYRAVKKAIFFKFEHLSKNEKTQLYDNVWKLADERDPIDDEWGFAALYNLPLLADAIALLEVVRRGD